jgi:hypothetical protein
MPNEPWAAPDKETADRWTTVLENRGAGIVGRLLVDSSPGAASIIGGTDGMPITKGFAENWVREQRRAAERRETRRFRINLAWTIVAAVAAIVAAWPVVEDWPVIKDIIH